MWHAGLARRIEQIIYGCGLIQTTFSIGGGRIINTPQVVAMTAGSPLQVYVRILPGQAPHDFTAHAETFAYNLGVAHVDVIAVEPFLIRLDLRPATTPPSILRPAA
jgi:hypothetical protein